MFQTMVKYTELSRRSAERRTRERADTREKILDAAREMFVQHGYEATTMRAIADRIEYTPTAIYHHFESKEALLTELANTDFRSLASAFVRIGRIEDPLERLVRTGQAYVEFALEHPMQYRLMFMTGKPQLNTGVQKGHGDPTQDAFAFLRETCLAAIKTGRLRPEFNDPDELAEMAWSSLHGLMSLYIVNRDHPWRDPMVTASRMCGALIRGFLRAETIA
jgi:AcrR family transcriptional regulator